MSGRGIRNLEYRGPVEGGSHPARDMVFIQASGLYIQRHRMANGVYVYRGLVGGIPTGGWHATIRGAARSLADNLARELILPTAKQFQQHETPPNDQTHDEPKRVFRGKGQA